MEITVRYVRIKKHPNRPAICFFDNRSRVHCVASEGNRIRIFKISFQEYIKSPLVPHNSGTYTPEAALDHFIKLSSQKPSTRAARELLLNIHERAEAIKIETGETGKSKKTRGKAILRLADEFNLEPKKIRKFLRKAGMSAPYRDDDETKTRLRRYIECLSTNVNTADGQDKTRPSATQVRK